MNPFATTPADHPPPSSPSPTAASSTAAPPTTEQWGTYVMGAPAAPSSHPDNQKAAAFWGANAPSSSTTTTTAPLAADQNVQTQHPYLVHSPAEKPAATPMDSILHVFNSWSSKAESLANNIWHNLKTNSSVSEAAWGKMNLTAKVITEGGFESLYKQTFATYPNEKLKKRFACYLSTTTGPVAGTLYLSNVQAAFCSDRPLSFTAPSGQQTWSYYKVAVPLDKIRSVNPVVMREKPTSEKYIQLVTVEGHDFWFMGFVNYDKACRHLTQGISGSVAHPPQPNFD
ncbi:GEM-like protein 5 [Linum perenne]